MKKIITVILIVLLFPTMISDAAILQNATPTQKEYLKSDVQYEYWDTVTDAGLLKMHTVSFQPSQKKAELKLGLSHQAVTGIQQLLDMAEDGNTRYNGNVIAGINGGFFSMDTSVGFGIPFDFMVQDGELYTSPPVTYQGEPYPPNGCDPYCIAMYNDNTAFVDSAPWMDITFHTGEDTYKVNHVNRMRMTGSYQKECPDAMVLYTDKFGDSTLTDSTGGQEVVIKIQKGRVRGGDVLEGTVESLSPAGKGNTAIPKGHVVLSGCNLYKDMLCNLKRGQTVYFSFQYEQERWNRVKFAMGGVQMLISDGWINSRLSGSAENGGYTSPSPMTAIGVKKDGTVILLAVDGRQPGYSNGLSVKQLAQLMLEHGCYNAIHLDGGGSTTMVVNRQEKLQVVNRPSGGSQRKIANGVLVVAYDSAQSGINTPFHAIPTFSQPSIVSSGVISNSRFISSILNGTNTNTSLQSNQDNQQDILTNSVSAASYNGKEEITLSGSESMGSQIAEFKSTEKSIWIIAFSVGLGVVVAGLILGLFIFQKHRT